ncbi:hypothetical protein NDI76_04235 [Halogeometricum sp. S1BR25-6]|uniref:Uncharacterized protein n=1 Tax=Halogeometricum salsisoli TaxID=2950536 RepID=A0ABU2GAX1_9EURY|nr:hypothetical protein [Halogeometricum sp. S1BR25-6]MDS0297942.1 hypothetical protein [Halogeometricum sp. S1BR25-6]
MSTSYPTRGTTGPRGRRTARAVLVAVGLFALGVLANLVLSVAVAVPLSSRPFSSDRRPRFGFRTAAEPRRSLLPKRLATGESFGPPY